MCWCLLEIHPAHGFWISAPAQVCPSKTFLIKGRWAIQVADDFPDAQVRGLDLAPIQPTSVPPNCTFEVGDMTTDLVPGIFDDASFDLVQARY